MDDILKIFIGTRKFQITPKYNSEFVKKRLIDNIGYKILPGLYINHCANDNFDATYKFGKSLATKISGQLSENSIVVICRPSVVMVLSLIFITAPILAGLCLLTTDLVNKNFAIYLLLGGFGLYFFHVILLYIVHLISMKRLLTIIDGGNIK